jgi:hypothetical protein
MTGEKHPQDVYVLQHTTWVYVWEAARRCEDFRDFHKIVRDATLSLRWTDTMEDSPAEAAKPSNTTGSTIEGGSHAL